MPLRGLSLVLAEAAPVRLDTALRLLSAAAALGGRARLLVDEAAVPLFAAPLPARTCALLDAAWQLGATVTLCQAGLAAADVYLDRLDPRLEGGGLIGFLAGLDEDRLVVV